MKRLLIIIPLLFLTITLAWSQGQTEGMKKLSLADFAITNLYVDEVDEGKLVEDAIRGMLAELDPHSVYSTAEETKELNEPLEGNFSGIGIQFNMNKDTLYVIQTIVGGPSEKVGVLAGDRIIEVNDTVIAGVKMKNTDIMKRLRGESGTTVRVKVLRKGVTEPIEFKIVRAQIPIHSIDAAYMADPTTGYIRVSRFAANTGQEFYEGLKWLKKKGMKNLIVDLQGNGGGYLSSAIEMTDEFLTDGQTIVYTEGKRSPRSDAYATDEGLFQEGKLVLLVDESSASASEILSGAIQDWDRGVIVGRRTFGKGLVQRPIPFPDGSMIRLTISRYYTPSGRSIQKPYDKGNEAYGRDIIERYNRGELIHSDSIHFPDSLQYKTLRNERVVYGGGGIMPDIFIPLDTTLYTDFHRDMVAKGVLNQYAVEYIDKERKSLKKQYKKVEAFNEGFVVTDEMLADLLKIGEAEKVEFRQEQYEKSRLLIARQVKALIARDLFDMAAYFMVINPTDNAYKKALEIIRDDVEYNRLLQRNK